MKTGYIAAFYDKCNGCNSFNGMTVEHSDYFPVRETFEEAVKDIVATVKDGDYDSKSGNKMVILQIVGISDISPKGVIATERMDK